MSFLLQPFNVKQQWAKGMARPWAVLTRIVRVEPAFATQPSGWLAWGIDAAEGTARWAMHVPLTALDDFARLMDEQGIALLIPPGVRSRHPGMGSRYARGSPVAEPQAEVVDDWPSDPDPPDLTAPASLRTSRSKVHTYPSGRMACWMASLMGEAGGLPRPAAQPTI